MKTTEKAVEKLKEELVTRISNVGLGFRIYQGTDGVNGSKLALKLDKKNPNDETIESHGVHLFLDPRYSAQLRDLELDYVDGPTGGFILIDHQKV
jgi:Fe-S cluster assembly iron-binding protein IscA